MWLSVNSLGKIRRSLVTLEEHGGNRIQSGSGVKKSEADTSCDWMFRRLIANEDSDDLDAEASACYQQWLAMQALGEVQEPLARITFAVSPGPVAELQTRKN